MQRKQQQQACALCSDEVNIGIKYTTPDGSLFHFCSKKCLKSFKKLMLRLSLREL